jgi:hypothetical protein
MNMGMKIIHVRSDVLFEVFNTANIHIEVFSVVELSVNRSIWIKTIKVLIVAEIEGILREFSF